ncbi:Pre-mRNA-splicing factor ATP-dependent RNA helicase prp22 [Smittium mucronatum]|uniref:Pre-mRNA-splicing factor ATP-dependent RNA helicase prp22 n=1 Tax=Smittium mucronatum TaxID=133383 RepID=A0A1R0GTG6_9FUNG|nr:Pre-mRNA-splicing factor ATP-dependent RNA helicase prp22 [Smittium mucronatum]
MVGPEIQNQFATSRRENQMIQRKRQELKLILCISRADSAAEFVNYFDNHKNESILKAEGSKFSSSILELFCKKEMIITPLYSGVSEQELEEIQSERYNSRRVIISTRIAESINLKGVRFVIDPGITKDKIFDYKKRVDVVQSFPISKSLADYRSSLAGNSFNPDLNGKCYRLYPSIVYKKEMSQFDIPELERIGGSQLSKLFLLVLLLTGNNASSANFDVIPPGPSKNGLLSAIETLVEMEIIDLGNKDKKLSPEEYKTIKSLVFMNIDPTLGICILASLETSNSYNYPSKFLPIDFSKNSSTHNDTRVDISLEIVIIAAMQSAGSAFSSNKSENEFNRQKLRFTSQESDHLGLLNVFLAYFEMKTTYSSTENSLIHWCFKHCLDYATLKKSFNVFSKLYRFLQAKNNKFSNSEMGQSVKALSRTNSLILNAKSLLIRKCLIRGFYDNICELENDGLSYRNVNTNQVSGSVLNSFPM